ncbi:pectinesterase-like [Andrographis paniculata]|uniref:pectinesterase-like n=1 Tax=Andrographis paniculata TaxID=175694 RepID=UPI0021E920C8|nr:pectinesterase-like [Andrographis paniculata]
MADKKKMAIAGLASILVVAMVVAVAVGVSKKSTGGDENLSSSTKAAHSICAPTDYKETCEASLANATSDDPKELVKAAFEATVKDIESAIKSSSLLNAAAADDRTKGALEVCKEVLHDSVDDLRRSFDRVDEFEMSKMQEYVEDVKTWLSGAIAHQDACLDAFLNTTGETGDKMKILLQTSGELLSNGLAMVDSFSSMFSSLGLDSFFSSSHRRLLSDQPPHWVDATARKLMEASPAAVKKDIVVAQDGSGDFKTITEAINSLAKKSNESIVVHVKAGVYKETVIVPKNVNNVKLIGDGPLVTRILGNKNYADGTSTYHTAVLAVNADGFMAKDIGIENTAGAEKHQAVAVRVSGDKAVFYNVHMDGYQDTLYTHSYRQYYRDCLISGTIDFIFGDAAAIFQKCKLVVRKPMENQACMVTAQGRKDRRSIGVTVLQGCAIVADPAFLAVTPPVNAYLGRPWKEFSRTIIMQSYIGGFISPDGWSPWMGSFALDTLYYGEYQNKGPGADMSKRVTWKGIQKMTPEIAESFTAAKVYQGDEWVKAAGVPYDAGMMSASSLLSPN